MEYPFVPKSNRWLEPGQFWPVRLSDGRYACGRVVAVEAPTDDPYVSPPGTRGFLAGLMDWVGENPPTAEDLAGSILLDQGLAHIGTITIDGESITGKRDLAQDNISALCWVTPVDLTNPVRYLYRGWSRVREARPEECQPYFGPSTWSKPYIRGRAEVRFVERKLPLNDYRTYAPFEC